MTKGRARRAHPAPAVRSAHRQLSLHVVVHGADPVARPRFGSLSQTTSEPFFLMYLYCTAVPIGRCAVARHTGYIADDSGTARAGSQLPSAAVSPTTNTF